MIHLSVLQPPRHRFRPTGDEVREVETSRPSLWHTHRQTIYLFLYLLAPWSRVLLEKLTGFATNQEITRILWNPKVHYRTHKRSPPVPILYQFHPVPTSWRSILILSSHLRLGLPNGLFPSGFPTKTLCTPLPSFRTCHMPRPSNSSRFYHPHNILYLIKNSYSFSVNNIWSSSKLELNCISRCVDIRCEIYERLSQGNTDKSNNKMDGLT